MYSPKINEDLIPDIYRLAKKQGKTMTKLVSQIIKEFLEKERRENDNLKRTG